MTGLHVIHPGLFTTIQDRGRRGYREWGVPAGGAFDQGASDIANALLGNAPECATLELTMFGGNYRATCSLAIALVGAPMEAILAAHDGDRRLATPLCCTLERGKALRIGGASAGVRMYLAVKGGWQRPLVLGSRSSETPLSAGDVLSAGPSATPTRHPAEMSWQDPLRRPIRVIEGPDARASQNLQAWLSSTFHVGHASDRMGFRLEGPALSIVSPPDRLSTPVAPGAVQVAGGRPLILGVACGTMGGYPHVAHVISADLDRLGQLRPGDAIAFEVVSLAEARRLDREETARRRDQCRRLSVLATDDSTLSSRD